MNCWQSLVPNYFCREHLRTFCSQLFEINKHANKQKKIGYRSRHTKNLKFLRGIPLMTLDPQNLHTRRRFLLMLSRLRVRNNWSVKSDQFSTWATYVCVEAVERCGSGFNLFLMNFCDLSQSFISKSYLFPWGSCLSDIGGQLR